MTKIVLGVTSEAKEEEIKQTWEKIKWEEKVREQVQTDNDSYPSIAPVFEVPATPTGSSSPIPRYNESKYEARKPGEKTANWGAVRFVTDAYQTIQRLFQTLSATDDAGTFIFTKEGVHLRMMDPIKVSMVDVWLSKDVFEEYSVEPIEGDFVSLSLRFDEVSKALKNTKHKATASIALYTNKDVVDKYIIEVRGAFIKRFGLNALTLATEDLPVPKLDSNVDIKLVSEYFKEAIGSQNGLVKFTANKALRTIRFQGETDSVYDESTESDSTIGPGNVAMLSFESKGDEPEERARYKMEYLKDILKGLYDVAWLSFSMNMPLKVVTTGFADITWYLAPCRES